MMLKRSKYSPPFKTHTEAQAWAYKQTFDDIWFLIHDREDEVYQLVNDSRLYYLQNCWGLDMRILETWE